MARRVCLHTRPITCNIVENHILYEIRIHTLVEATICSRESLSLIYWTIFLCHAPSFDTCNRVEHHADNVLEINYYVRNKLLKLKHKNREK
jgi:hypothetical protein